MPSNTTRVRAAPSRVVAPPVVHAAIASPGRALDTPTREFFEPRFGHDFSQVRIHTDRTATESARAIQAQAYTVGREVVFGAGQYSPRTPATRRLLAHELAHVVQQRNAAPASELCIDDRDGGSERDARATERDLIGSRAHGGPALSDRVVQRRSILDSIAGLFSGDDFSDQELQTYLKLLDTKGQIEDYNESDNKARAVVRHWKRGDSQYLLPPKRKILLIREMLSGFTGDDDELAILDLLKGSPDAEVDQILAAISVSTLDSALQGEEQDRLDAFMAARRKRQPTPAGRDEETFDPQTISELQQHFTENSEAVNRLNCIEIIRDVAPRLLAADPDLAERVQARLSKLRGQTLTMVHLGDALADLGLVSASHKIRFNHQNGNDKVPPDQMLESAWDTIIADVGTHQGWHVFGLAVFDGYHSVTILVDNRPDGPRVYWADQWNLKNHEDFKQEEGSVSGFRRYTRDGLDAWLTEYTRTRWLDVFTKKKKRYNATLHIWKFRSALEENADAGESR